VRRRTSASHGFFTGYFRFRGKAVFYGRFVKCFDFSIHDPEGAGGAVADACAQSVAVLFGNQTGLPVDDLQGAFFASGNALAASITQILIDFDDFS
jgi:hypothetical protein